MPRLLATRLAVLALALGFPQPARAAQEGSCSADGRWVVFASAASDLVATDANGCADVFVLDRASGAVELVSLAADGTQADGASCEPTISADGRYVVYRSLATNLAAGDANGEADLFVHDRASGATERLLRLAVADTLHEEGAPPGADRSSPAIPRAGSTRAASGPPILPGTFELTDPLDGAEPSGIVPIVLSWSASTDQDSYLVEIDDDINFASINLTYPVAGNLTSQVLDTGLVQFEQPYYWRVHALNTAGDTLAWNAPFQITLSTPSFSHSDSMGFCFVATAAYGSPMEPEVQTLRAFRDRVLLRCGPGRAFVAWYYRTSPPLASAIAERPAWRRASRALLWPVVGTAHVALWMDEHPRSAAALACALAAAAWIAARGLRSRLRARGVERRSRNLCASSSS